jgi:energy-coupling factor transporter ATP-binding protein EcfA2
MLDRKELFKDIVETIPSTSTIAIIGKMRSGKTTFALSFSEYIRDYYSSKKYSTSLLIFNPSDLENPREIENKISVNSRDVNIIIFDDLSFIVSGYNKLVRNFLNLITRIAHVTFSDYNYIFFIGHYSRAISPFLRASNVVVLTSISHPEINALKELFTLSSLYDYLYYYSENPKRYIYLVKYHVYERIIDFTIEIPNIEIPLCEKCLEALWGEEYKKIIDKIK